MCEALRELMKDEIEKDVNAAKKVAIAQGLEQGLAQGKELGLAQGKAETQKKIILTMKNNGLEADNIAKVTGIDLEDVKVLFAE